MIKTFVRVTSRSWHWWNKHNMFVHACAQRSWLTELFSEALRKRQLKTPLVGLTSGKNSHKKLHILLILGVCQRLKGIYTRQKTLFVLIMFFEAIWGSGWIPKRKTTISQGTRAGLRSHNVFLASHWWHIHNKTQQKRRTSLKWGAINVLLFLARSLKP